MALSGTEKPLLAILDLVKSRVFVAAVITIVFAYIGRFLARGVAERRRFRNLVLQQ